MRRVSPDEIVAGKWVRYVESLGDFNLEISGVVGSVERFSGGEVEVVFKDGGFTMSLFPGDVLYMDDDNPL